MTDLDRDATTGDPLALLRPDDDGSPVGLGAGEGAEGAADGDGSDSSDLFDDAQWDRPPLMNRVTRVLLVAILVVAGFGGGVWLQKSHDASSSGATAGSLAAAFSAAGRGAGARAGAGFAAGAVGGGTGTGTRTGSPAAAASASPPVVVGTVTTVSATALVVTNFAGTAVTVTVPATATVTTDGLAPLTAGQTVSVTGTKQADGTVVATALTAHAAG